MFRKALGVGGHLQRFFRWFSLRDDGKCHCATIACVLDNWGPDRCTAQFKKILRILARSAAKRGIPFAKHPAKIVLRWAIAEARREEGALINNS